MPKLGRACIASRGTGADKKLCGDRLSGDTKKVACVGRHIAGSQSAGLHDEGITNPEKTYPVQSKIPSTGQMCQTKDVSDPERRSQF